MLIVKSEEQGLLWIPSHRR